MEGGHTSGGVKVADNLVDYFGCKGDTEVVVSDRGTEDTYALVGHGHVVREAHLFKVIRRYGRARGVDDAFVISKFSLDGR